MTSMRAFLLSIALIAASSPLVAASSQERAPAAEIEHGHRVDVDASDAFRDVITRARRHSPTFQRQYLRLLRARPIRIRILLDEPQRRASARARSVIVRQAGEIVAADIYLPLAADTTELLAHELEHVIEQLDRVDLAAHRHSGDVWTASDGTVETRRAIEVGRRVAMESRVFVTTSARRP